MSSKFHILGAHHIINKYGYNLYIYRVRARYILSYKTWLATSRRKAMLVKALSNVFFPNVLTDERVGYSHVSSYVCKGLSK